MLNVQASTHACTHICMHLFELTARSHTRARPPMHACAYTHTCALTHAHAHTHAHTHTRTCTLTHTHTTLTHVCALCTHTHISNIRSILLYNFSTCPSVKLIIKSSKRKLNFICIHGN